MGLYEKRKLWIDTARGIAIILVVYGHVAAGLMNAGLPVDRELFSHVNHGIYAFHMPLFFLLSGLLFPAMLAATDARDLFWVKVRTIAYPYVLWSLLQGFIEVAMAGLTNGHASLTGVLAVAWQPRAQFWFLYALFYVSCASIAIYAHTRGRQRDLLIPLAVGLFLLRENFSAVPPLFFVAENFVYFVLGISLQRFMDAILHVRRRMLLPAVLLLMAGQCAVYIGDGLVLAPAARSMAYLTVAITCLASVLVIALNLDRNKPTVLTYLGQCSLAIYLMHTLACAGVRIILQKFMHVTDPWIHLGLGVGCGIAFPVIALAIIDRLGWTFLLRFPAPAQRAPAPAATVANIPVAASPAAAPAPAAAARAGFYTIYALRPVYVRGTISPFSREALTQDDAARLCIELYRDGYTLDKVVFPNGVEVAGEQVETAIKLGTPVLRTA